MNNLKKKQFKTTELNELKIIFFFWKKNLKNLKNSKKKKLNPENFLKRKRRLPSTRTL